MSIIRRLLKDLIMVTGVLSTSPNSFFAIDYPTKETKCPKNKDEFL